MEKTLIFVLINDETTLFLHILNEVNKLQLLGRISIICIGFVIIWVVGSQLMDVWDRFTGEFPAQQKKKYETHLILILINYSYKILTFLHNYILFI